jgi:hypothetical protein
VRPRRDRLRIKTGRRLVGFDLVSFTGELLANIAGAGADFELMPSLNGNVRSTIR